MVFFRLHLVEQSCGGVSTSGVRPSDIISMSEIVFVLGEIKFIYTDVELEGGISLKYQFAFLDTL